MTTKSAIKVLWSMVLLFFRDVYTMHHRNVCVIIIIDHFYILPLLYITVFCLFFRDVYTMHHRNVCVIIIIDHFITAIPGSQADLLHL